MSMTSQWLGGHWMHQTKIWLSPRNFELHYEKAQRIIKNVRKIKTLLVLTNWSYFVCAKKWPWRKLTLQKSFLFGTKRIFPHSIFVEHKKYPWAFHQNIVRKDKRWWEQQEKLFFWSSHKRRSSAVDIRTRSCLSVCLSVWSPWL